MVLSSIARGGAAEWSAEPSLSVKGEYNSNLILTALPHDDTWGHWVSPSVKFAGSTESLEVSGKAAADFVRYYGGQERSLTNLMFPLSLRYTAERETFNLEGGFTRDNTLMGELSQTGVVLSFTQRNLWNLAPVWTHALTERFSLQAGYQYAKATYEDGVRLGLVDYTVHGAIGGLLYQPTEIDQVKVTGVYTNFHAPQAGDLRSEIYSGQMSLAHYFSDSVIGTLAGGPSLVRGSVGPGSFRLSDIQVVWLYNASVKKQWEGAAVQVEVAREVLPSGFGLLLQTDRVGVSVSKNVTERLTASLSAQVLVASSVASDAVAFTFPENRYINVAPRLTWKVAKWWALDLAYSYAHRHVESFDETAVGNAATVTLTYFPPKLSVGR
jgi:hypothetical protein